MSKMSKCPFTQPPIGGSESTNQKSSNRIVTNLGVIQWGGRLGGWNWVGVSSQNKNLQTD